MRQYNVVAVWDPAVAADADAVVDGFVGESPAVEHGGPGEVASLVITVGAETMADAVGMVEESIAEVLGEGREPSSLEVMLTETFDQRVTRPAPDGTQM